MPVKILIIEDDRDIASIESDYLVANGFETEICSDGLSGLESGLSGKYDLILLDIMLPKMDGFTVCRMMKGKKNEKKVLYYNWSSSYYLHYNWYSVFLYYK